MNRSKFSFLVGTLCIVAGLCFSSLAVADMTLNIDINGRSNGGQINVTNSGAAVIGEAGDVWNGYAVDGAVAGIPLDPAQSDFLVDASGNATTVKFDLSLVGADAPLATGDDMGNDLAFTGPGFPALVTMTLSGLQAGDVYDMYLDAPLSASVYASKFTIDGLSLSTVPGTPFTGTWRHGMDYVKFPRVVVAANNTIECGFEAASTSYATFSGLQMTTSPPVVEVIGTPVNIDISGRSAGSQTNVTKSGAAAIGAAGDVWNGYSVDGAVAGIPLDPAQSDFLLDANGNATTIKFDLSLVGADAPMSTIDDMGNDLAFIEGAEAGTGFPQSASVTLSGLEAGAAYDLYLYAPAASEYYASIFTIGETSLATPGGSVFTGIWVEDDNYVKFSSIVAAGDGTIECAFDGGNPASYATFSGLQIVPSNPIPEPSLLVMLAAIAMSALFVRRK